MLGSQLPGIPTHYDTPPTPGQISERVTLLLCATLVGDKVQPGRRMQTVTLEQWAQEACSMRSESIGQCVHMYCGIADLVLETAGALASHLYRQRSII